MVFHFLSQNDLTGAEIGIIFEHAAEMKAHKMSQELASRSLVMFFEKSSTRTRLSFEIGMTQLGGHAVYLDRDSSQLSRGESIADTSRVVSRYADLIMARVYAHATIEELAANSSIPVINGLSDSEHPCQSMADLFTINERKGSLQGLTIAYVGDGDNNVTHSLLLGATLLGATIRVGSPPGYEPEEKFVGMAQANGRRSGASVIVTNDPLEAVQGSDVVYTDVWVSMGREADSESRKRDLHPFQVNAHLVAHAKPDYLFLHCLPAHMGEEVTADVAYGDHSAIFDEAENRLHVQKALMVYLLRTSEGDM